MCEGLNAPRSFREANSDERARVSNGCGPGWSAFDVVPDNLLGLSIACACDIHDWMYARGSTTNDKDRADTWFYWNMKRLIDDDGGVLRVPRLCLAWWYHRAVRRLGARSFSGGV